MCICWKLCILHKLPMDSQVMPETALSIGFTIHNLQMRPRECAVLSKVKQAESMVTLAYNLTQEAETGEMPRIQGQLVLRSSRTGAIVRHCLKKAKTKQQQTKISVFSDLDSQTARATFCTCSHLY